MKTYKLNNIEISEKDLKQLIQDNPELLKENGVPFENGDDYFCEDGVGSYSLKTWRNNDFDFYRLDTGNAFKTREEAEKKAQQMQALARVNKYIRENYLRLTDVDWSDEQNSKWCIFYDGIYKTMQVTNWCSSDYKMLIGDLKSKEAGEQVIKNCIDDLKIIFDVK